MNIAIILAGGKGVRAGFDLPKQFIEVFGKPIIAYTLEAFQNNNNIDLIEIVCIRDFKNLLIQIIAKYNLSKVKFIADGGSSFQESVYNGVKNLRGKIKDDDDVIVHFAASPFINDGIINDSIRVCNLHGNAISSTDFFLLPGIKIKDTSVSDVKNYTCKYINRDTIACMSTPHTFKFSLINEIYDLGVSTGKINEVEPHTTTLMYALGYKIYFSKGSQTNIKITNKEDVDLFKGYVLAKQLNK